MAEERIPLENNPVEGRETSSIAEAEVQELKSRLEKLESQLSREKTGQDKEKIVKQEIKSYIRELQQLPVQAAPLATRDQAKEIKKFEPGQQVGALISLALQVGLKQAVEAATQLDNPAILDEFHDALVDHYYQQLIEKEFLKPF